MKTNIFAVIAMVLLFTGLSFSQGIVQTSLSVTSPVTAVTAVGTGTTVTGIGSYQSMGITAVVQGGSGGTLDIYIQTSYDSGTTWYDYAHYPQITSLAAAVTKVWNVSGYAEQKTITTIGSGTSPALAASTIVGGRWGDQLRILFVSGAGTTGGASQTFTFSFAK